MRPPWHPPALACIRAAATSRCRPLQVSFRSASTSPLDFAAIDAKWQPRWKDHTLWSSPQAPKGKYFVMPMFPYPSGALHIGHLRNYTISDVIARHRRMSGYHVLHPIGWDAFGLPAENAAIERGVNPAAWTLKNVASMKGQIEAMGGCWDWDKELRTCDPAFYRDTQRLFLELHRHRLAYQAEATVNYDPVDKTVLANEQVDSNGCSWRSGAKVQQLRLKQWFVKITEYAQELLDDLAHLEAGDKWPARVLAMQKNWLGRSKGSSLAFRLQGSAAEVRDLEVFTTRADTLFGVQYLALSLDHPIVKHQAVQDKALQGFIEHAPYLPADTKAGFRLSGLKATNPLSRLFPELDYLKGLPVFAAPYVRSDYASGAVMGVPAHDSRDFAFWQHNRAPGDAPPRQVIRAIDSGPASSVTEPVEAFTSHGMLTEECLHYEGQMSAGAATQIVKDLQAAGDTHARETVSWRMRDWLISRQRYWGTPIPIIHCPSCGPVPVPDSDLPVELPLLSDEQWKGLRGNPLESDHQWLNTSCPKCAQPAKRETDTMDTFVDSSWYFLRFAQSAQTESQSSRFMPVDLYIGGVEHAILHLLYARFISKFLAKTRNQPELSEPFQRLLTQGMVHGRTYSDPDTGRFLKPETIDAGDPNKPIIKATGKIANVSFEKMSKSKFNGVDPLSCMATYGADTTRAHLLFQAPVSDVLDWDEAKIAGIQRWFKRLWTMAHRLQGISLWSPSQGVGSPVELDGITSEVLEMWKQTQKTIQSVDESFMETFALNTVISDLMSLTNTVQQLAADVDHLESPEKKLVFEGYSTILRLLAPIAPSFAEECWAVLYDSVNESFAVDKTVSHSGFPQPDGSLDRLHTSVQPCAVQVNGKLRFVAQIRTPPEDLSGESLKDWIVAMVAESPEGREAQLKGRFDPQAAKKIIVVRGGRTLNLVQ